MSDKLRFNENDLTIGDLEDFEEVVGQSMDEVFSPKAKRDAEGNFVLDDNGKPVYVTSPSPKALKALVWIIRRKDNPEFTLDDARGVKVTELELVSEDDPKDAAA